MTVSRLVRKFYALHTLRVRNRPPLAPIPSQTNQAHSLPFYFLYTCVMHFNVILCPLYRGHPRSPYPSVFPAKTLYGFGGSSMHTARLTHPNHLHFIVLFTALCTQHSYTCGIQTRLTLRFIHFLVKAMCSLVAFSETYILTAVRIKITDLRCATPCDLVDEILDRFAALLYRVGGG